MHHADGEDDAEYVGEGGLYDEHGTDFLAGSDHGEHGYDHGGGCATADETCGGRCHSGEVEAEVEDAGYCGGRYGEKGGGHYDTAPSGAYEAGELDIESALEEYDNEGELSEDIAGGAYLVDGDEASETGDDAYDDEQEDIGDLRPLEEVSQEVTSEV